MSHTIVIFGASGDLTSRKLIPALYSLFCKKRLPDKTQVVGFSRTAFSHDQWRKKLAESTAEFLGDVFDNATWSEFAKNIYYQPGDIGKAEDFKSLDQTLSEIEESPSCTRVYYLSTAPRFYEPAVTVGGRWHGIRGRRSSPRGDREAFRHRWRECAPAQ